MKQQLTHRAESTGAQEQAITAPAQAITVPERATVVAERATAVAGRPNVTPERATAAPGGPNVERQVEHRGAQGRPDHRRPEAERGQATAEYALVMLAAAGLAGLLIAWASSTDGVKRLLDAVIDSIIRSV